MLETVLAAFGGRGSGAASKHEKAFEPVTTLLDPNMQTSGNSGIAGNLVQSL
jgi:hypothetical protein